LYFLPIGWLPMTHGKTVSICSPFHPIHLLLCINPIVDCFHRGQSSHTKPLGMAVLLNTVPQASLTAIGPIITFGHAFLALSQTRLFALRGKGYTTIRPRPFVCAFAYTIVANTIARAIPWARSFRAISRVPAFFADAQPVDTFSTARATVWAGHPTVTTHCQYIESVPSPGSTVLVSLHFSS